ncbi:putative 3-amino-3-carboxypropyl transferase protein [Rosellinia necatrix]|uniref:Putative 3-amino-3-carboxypropyl transferase protein n=1 Tax=Rosellinia necatrix TaxID=77044 RepID=A0A1S8AAM1_ROSNE|nr:putative 3-amino-3-carboxypropyl transferase protein [Rosellinia necatrix]
MDFLGGNILPRLELNIFLIGIGVFLLAGTCYSLISARKAQDGENPTLIRSLWLFFYSCFIKPHKGDSKGNQQDALESFYKSQAGAYDATRKGLLKGREDMLALAAAQLQLRIKPVDSNAKNIWVDIGGGTGWNIEAMSHFVDVPAFFDSVYLVDFSPSLCEVARRRFARLGWTNVKIVCQDARTFRLEDHEPVLHSGRPRSPETSYFSQERPRHAGANLITMSYSLSMIPDYYSVVDSLISLLAPDGIIGVVDFYVQSRVDISFRNYTGGLIDRHVNFLGRTFWRAWFDIDRVALEPGRRDYLEYRFGTVLNVNTRNYVLGAIPYHIWLGTHKQPLSSSLPHEIVAKVDALVTESPYLYPTNHSDLASRATGKGSREIHSKAFDAAIINLSSNLPLPSFFYQNHHYRIYYDDQLKKHTQFNNDSGHHQCR